MDFKSNLAQIAQLASINVPTGETRFSYFGGDLRIARERGYSNELRLLATGITGTARGSFGFDRSLNYNGTGVLDVQANGTSSTGSSSAGGGSTNPPHDVAARRWRSTSPDSILAPRHAR
jgi:hypothetical protein